MTNRLKLTGYSTGLFSTWYFVSQYGVLFDCGDGVTAHLMQKARKVKHCFISHADRDHLTGLLQFLQLNGRPDLTVYYPKDCGSFLALAEFTSKFDPHVAGTRWQPMEHDERVSIGVDLQVRSIQNRHVPNKDGQTKSLSFALERVRRKLKPELQNRSGSELAAIRNTQGPDAITFELRTTELIYSGDTPVEFDGRYDGARTLIHEATFLTRDELDLDNQDRNRHSSLDDLMKMIAQNDIANLIIGHFSSRYRPEEIDMAIEREATANGITIPIQRILPGEVANIVA